MLELDRPLLLDGEMSEGWRAFVPGPETCPEEWLLEHPGLVLTTLAACREGGADLLTSPTLGANVLALSEHEKGENFFSINLQLAELTRTAAPELPVLGGLGPSGHLFEPFGPLPYTDLIDTYAEQALALKEGGVQGLLIQDMPSLGEARAALLGARQAHLPVLVSLTLGEDGKTQAGDDPLGVLICLQELGIAAFGLGGDSPEELLLPLRRIAPYAKVPLMAFPGLGEVPPEEVSKACWELLAAGARILGGGRGAVPEHMGALRILLDEFDDEAFPPPPPSQDPALLLSNGSEVYYLEGETIFSQPIAVTPEVSGAILEEEGKPIDALLFRLEEDIREAWHLGQHLHLCHTAVCFEAEREEALEMALLYYSGRALIRSDTIHPSTLLALAEGYGAVVV